MAEAVQWLVEALGFTARPYALGGALLIVLYVIQAEVRFGSKARSGKAGASDRRSSLVLTLASLVPVAGLVTAIKLAPLAIAPRHPLLAGLFGETLPGLPALAWAGVVVGLAGLGLRLWAVLTLRHRYTRTLLVHQDHAIERGGPYRFVRHPGYLGSLLCLNAVALTSGSAPVFIASLLATIAGYAYRIRSEDQMLVAALGAPYEAYRAEVGALSPRLR
ncbi:isoprenylcysteine carboxylmethyltransferase family protein [Phenylobacterium sp.]|uniref:methyltransferase family protein n=1 Tax=Phenylobacterium sp. TaxID=1871053 RepID=UPI002DEF848E|nr:isoprenylcysteine carboxylmethyltransferase family protein [Phenylobacterium sp.]